jgi:PHD/YefM family antitoxin component YafN of YafNO toxin-antitoxin module
MVILTIPKKLTKKGDLVVIPRKEYEGLMALKKTREFVPSSAQKSALLRAKKSLKQGKTLSYNELASKLGFGN